jgi:hypothetical protein
MVRIREATTVMLAIGILAALFLVIYEVGDSDPASRSPIVTVR